MTIKQRKWFKEYIATGNATEAAMRTYNCKDRLSARNVGSVNLAKVGISDEVKFWLDKEGLTDQKIIGRINWLIDNDNHQAVNNGLEKAMKLKGYDKSKIDITSGGKPIAILGGDSVHKDDSNKKDTATKETN